MSKLLSRSLDRMATSDSALFLINEINKNLRYYEAILAIIGLFYTGNIAIKLSSRIVNAFRVFVLARLVKKNLKKYGKWAVVTGATDGVGKEYARQLASRGLNIIIISRSLEKLERTASELESEFSIETCLIQTDFSEGRSIYSKIQQKLEGKEIGILVNNVGTMYENPSKFLNVPETKLWDLININMASVTMMTYLVLPQMVQRKRGAIINVSSISGFYPLPLMACYSASKIYVDWFSQALSTEYKSQGITVQCLIPSYIATKMVGFSKALSTPSPIVPDPKTFVSSALATLGVSDRTTGYWSHGIQYFFFEHTPQSIWNIISPTLQRLLDTSQKEN